MRRENLPSTLYDREGALLPLMALFWREPLGRLLDRDQVGIADQGPAHRQVRRVGADSPAVAQRAKAEGATRHLADS